MITKKYFKKLPRSAGSRLLRVSGCFSASASCSAAAAARGAFGEEDECAGGAAVQAREVHAFARQI